MTIFGKVSAKTEIVGVLLQGRYLHLDFGENDEFGRLLIRAACYYMLLHPAIELMILSPGC